MSMLQTILHVFCVLFKKYCRLFGHTHARILYPRHPCSSTFTCFEIQDNTSYQILIPLRKSVIGDNTTNTEAEKLPDNSVPILAFEFVIYGQFAARLWRNYSCQKMELIKIFLDNTVLPKLAEAWL